jgi:signal transduction histidine kinase
MMPGMTWSNINHIRLLRYAGLTTYLCVALPLLPGSWSLAQVNSWWSNPDISGWIFSYLTFGVTYLLLTRRSSVTRQTGLPPIMRLIGLVILTGSAIAMGWFSQSGLSAMLMLVIAVVLPWQLPVGAGLMWMLMQNLMLIPIIASYKGWTTVTAILQVCMYLGISALVFFTSMIASLQAEEREAQRRLNSELRATRALLAESTRIAERMRIARDLHDLIGHHLTALSLNLEVASHLTNPQAAEHVLKAQATAKHLLSDVREVVSELRQDDAIDLTQALRSLVEGVPGLNVQLDTPPRFSVEDPRRAQVLLRCAQEIITNTARHAGARNLWLRFDYVNANLLELAARDDGRGATNFRPGNGLSGMRERLAEFGGSVMVDPALHQGFALTVRLPLGEAPELAHTPSRFEPPALGML